MNQTTNAILMIRPVAFRMNEQTAVNNYYQKVLDGLLPATVNAKAQQEFDAFVAKLEAVGVEVIVVQDTLNPDTPDSIFPNNWISFHENGDIALFPMFAENRRLERREEILDILEDNGFIISLDDNAKYGIYLWRGTRDEIASGAVAGIDSDSIQSTYEAIWDRKPDLNPGKGTKGIKPRYWLNLIAADIDELQNEIDKAVTDAWDKQQKTNQNEEN